MDKLVLAIAPSSLVGVGWLVLHSSAAVLNGIWLLGFISLVSPGWQHREFCSQFSMSPHVD